jgi:hypothetical protein
MTGAGIASTPAGPLPLGQLRAVFRDLLVGYRQAVSAFGQHEATFRIGGQQVQMRSAGAAPLAVLEAALEHLRRPASTPADVAICVFAGGPAHAFSALPPPGVYVALRSGLQMTVTAQPAAVTAYDPRVRLGIVWLAGDPWAHVRAYAAPLREVLAAAMRPQGLMGLHAAAVGNEHGGALLAGMHFAGEDFCLVRSAPGPESAPLAFSLYGSAKLAPSSLAWLQPPLCGRHRAQHRRQARVSAAPCAGTAGGRATAAAGRARPADHRRRPPRGCAPPRRSRRSTRWRPTSVRLMGLPAQAAAAVFHSAATLVRQVRCYRLELGADVMATPALVAAAIRGEAAHAC